MGCGENMAESGVKCVVWDLDNTIWDGILLEGDSVRLKPRIQEVLDNLDRRGILNSIASRNDHDLAMAKLRELGIAEYFLYPEIRWDAKSVSLRNIQKNLNIGFDTLLFLDDQPFDRDEVASVHGDVWCMDSRDYLQILEHSRLNPKYVTSDSALRRRMYLDEITRRKEEDAFVGPKEDFLRQLNMVFEISEAQESDLMRAEELTYRTNQLNATGKKYSVESLDAMRRDARYKILVCELRDKYGSYGKIGLALVKLMPGAWNLKLLLFSCRVLSAGVGGVLLTYLRNASRDRGARLTADFLDTGHNRMMRATYMVSGFTEEAQRSDGITVLENDLTDVPPLPDFLDIQINVNWSVE
jgi:FkbH-like protein